MQRNHSDTYQGLKFLERYGKKNYKKDMVYCGAIAIGPMVLGLVLSSQLGWLIPFELRLSLLSLGFFLSIIVGILLWKTDTEDLPGFLTYPSVLLWDEGLREYDGGVTFYDSRGTPRDDFRVRVSAGGERWEFVGSRGMWRATLTGVNRLRVGEDIVSESLKEQYGSPSSRVNLDLERVEEKIDIDSGEWKLKE